MHKYIDTILVYYDLMHLSEFSWERRYWDISQVSSEVLCLRQQALTVPVWGSVGRDPPRIEEEVENFSTVNFIQPWGMNLKG